jgi:ABC-2 type transport system ATP-binding protein
VNGLKYPIELLGLTKRFTVKKTLSKEELGFLKFMKRLIRRTKNKESILAIDNVSFKIEKGEFFGLIGPNGAGKTTLIETLCTLLWPDAGTAQVNGYDIRKEPKKVKDSIGAVLDIQLGWSPRLSCRQNLLFYAQLYGIPPSRAEKRVWKSLELVGLTEKADDWQQKLSSGMKRKLDVARALLPDPPVLLLDEPTLQLDPKSARDFRRTVKNELCGEQSKTVLWTTHNMSEAEEVCDRVALLHKGKLVAIGKPEEVTNLIKTGENITAEVGKMTPDLLTSLEHFEGVVSVSSTQLSEEIFRLKIQMKNENMSPQISQTIMRGGALLYSMTKEKPTLEDALIRLTGEK